jgi:hypothetical protein
VHTLTQGGGFFDEVLADALHLTGELVEVEHGVNSTEVLQLV